MLVLTRKRGERIFVGSDIVIEIIDTGKYTVRIGIEAPKQIEILREELAIDKYREERRND